MISTTSSEASRKANSHPLTKDPLWYKDAIVYELHVRAFLDSNADGIGDFPGLTQKLDYLQDLGVTAIWLLPFYPSPLKDDGYDIADYYSLNPMYGTLEDFQTFLDEAHRRQLRVITELVVNHTSDKHAWFQRARRAPQGSPWRDFYVWSDTPEKYKEARIIFRDFEPSNWSWDRVAQAYYWHRFYSHQPDLNYDNPAVHDEIIRVMDFWLDMGVDGLRLDAVPYLYEREGTSCENLPKTHEFLKKLRTHVDSKYGDRMLLGEANQWPEDSVAYFGGGKGDECHVAFHFPLMPRIFMSVRMEDRVPITDILEQTPAIPETSQWAVFLRNHDELTLEMVTDEERDYMYRVYAQDAKARINLGIRRRLAPLLGNDRKRIELLNLLLLTYPGTPFLYYGDEIGLGDNIYLGDRNGVRTPMQWSSDKNAGFSRAHPHALYLPIILDPEYHYEAVNVEAQRSNPHSLWWWTKRVLALRKRYRAFGRGSIEFLQPENRKVLAFIRRYEDEIILVVANLSRFSQPVELNLAAYKQHIPLELFGRTDFPAIGEHPYAMTLSPHSALLFQLQPVASRRASEPVEEVLPVLRLEGTIEDLWQPRLGHDFERVLTNWLVKRRWFGGKGREIRLLRVRDSIPLDSDQSPTYALLLQVEFVHGDPHEYLLPLRVATGQEREDLERDRPHLRLSRLVSGEKQELGVLYDASGGIEFARTLFDALRTSSKFRGGLGELRARSNLDTTDSGNLEFATSRAEQSNSSILVGDKYFIKLFRKLEPGLNPDLEIGEFLTARKFQNAPAVAGSFTYYPRSGDPTATAIVTTFYPNAKDGWEYTLDSLSRYFERIRSLPVEGAQCQSNSADLLALSMSEPSEAVVALVGTYLESARLLGQRTGELHLALSSETEDPAFVPEPFTPFYQRGLYQSMRNLGVQTFQTLRQSLSRVPETERALAEEALRRQPEILERFQAVHQTRLRARRIRCHGDYHLGQTLHTGKDFIILDFEGEPARALSERRIKRTPLRDVAGMLRSFHYVTYAALDEQHKSAALPPDRASLLESWANFWYCHVSAEFLRAYFAVLAGTEVLPESSEETRVLLEASLLEKAVYEIGYELHNRPTWLRIPLRGVLQLLQREIK